MTDFLSKPYAAFAGMRLIARGALVDVAVAAKMADTGNAEPLLVFDEATGGVVDLDLRGDTAEIVQRLTDRAKQDAAETPRAPKNRSGPKRGRGRPKLGVVAREVTLLPRHWEWLGAQPGGASPALRRLVDQARRADGGETEARNMREAAYRFMVAIAGDLPGFEEATRALFANDRVRFAQQISDWPADVCDYAMHLAFAEPDGEDAAQECYPLSTSR